MNGKLTEIGVASGKIAGAGRLAGEQLEQFIQFGLFWSAGRLCRKQHGVFHFPISHPPAAELRIRHVPCARPPDSSAMTCRFISPEVPCRIRRRWGTWP